MAGLVQPETKGIVYLVGSGPGAVEYLTVKAHRILQQADVVVYDALVDTEALQLVPESCIHIDVGKRGGTPSTPQATINHILVEQCQQQKRVVRLKSGDPFIFGRCMAEIEALRAAHCAYEIVPGLSSALAAPLLAGIPLTDPVLSQGFSVVSAHDPDNLNWDALAQMTTLVVLMGTRHLEVIVAALHERGRSPKTPIAIIQWASQPQQRVWVATLESILHKTARQKLSPAVIIIGEVVGLMPYIAPNGV